MCVEYTVVTKRNQTVLNGTLNGFVSENARACALKASLGLSANGFRILIQL